MIIASSLVSSIEQVLGMHLRLLRTGTQQSLAKTCCTSRHRRVLQLCAKRDRLFDHRSDHPVELRCRELFEANCSDHDLSADAQKPRDDDQRHRDDDGHIWRFDVQQGNDNNISTILLAVLCCL